MKSIEGALPRAALVAVMGLMGCASVPGVQPEVRGVETRVTGLDLDGIDLAFDVSVWNPLLTSLHVPRFSYALDVQDRTLASGHQSASSEFPATGVGVVHIPVRVMYADLRALYGDIEGRSEASYRLSGEFKVPLFGSNVDLPFDHEGTFPIVRPPKVAVRAVDTSALSALGGDVHVDLDVTNTNAFALGLADVGYGLRVRGRDVGTLLGSTGGEVAPGATRTLRLTGHLSAADAVRGLLSGSGETAEVHPTGSVTTPYGPLHLR